MSGFVGIATSRVEFLNGCIQFCLVPKVGENNKREDGVYFDAQQIEVIGDGVSVEAKKTGGPTPAGTPIAYRG